MGERQLGSTPDDKGLIEDAARFYHRITGFSEKRFIDAAQSMEVNTRLGQADALMTRYGANGGKYRMDIASAGDQADKLIELVKRLVAKESRGTALSDERALGAAAKIRVMTARSSLD